MFSQGSPIAQKTSRLITGLFYLGILQNWNAPTTDWSARAKRTCLVSCSLWWAAALRSGVMLWDERHGESLVLLAVVAASLLVLLVSASVDFGLAMNECVKTGVGGLRFVSWNRV